jgi:hypothetical protein
MDQVWLTRWKRSERNEQWPDYDDVSLPIVADSYARAQVIML